MRLMIINFLNQICTYYNSNTDFVNDIIVGLIGVIVGAILTVFVNNTAARKQAKFEMQREHLTWIAGQVHLLNKEISTIETSIGFLKRKPIDLSDSILEVYAELPTLSLEIKSRRKFIRKYLKASDLEMYNSVVTSFRKVFFDNKEFTKPTLRNEISNENIQMLYDIEDDLRRLEDNINNGIEKLISPGLFSFIGRKLRSVGMLFDECKGICDEDRRQKKRRKYKDKNKSK